MHAEWRSKNRLVLSEKDRIPNEGEMMDRIKNAVQNAEFQEATQTCSPRALKLLELDRQREAETGHVAFTLVRREALRRLLEQERQLYVNELSQKGLAIHQQRI